METQTAIHLPGKRLSSSSLYHLINDVTQSLAPDTFRSKSAIINDVPEDLIVNTNKELLASVLSSLMNLVITNTENSRIRITSKQFGNVVLIHVKDDGCLSYDSISQRLTKIQSLAERLGGFVGFTSYRNKLTTIAFSFMNMDEVA
jgi:C4-dicarboxylate-specific signal transduction histidine kinase